MMAPLLPGLTARITTYLQAGMVQCSLALAIASLALASFGFASAAAYVAIKAWAGPVIALGAMAAVCGLLALGLLVLSAWRQRRARSAQSAALASTPAPVTVEHMLAVLAAAKGSPLTAALLATQQLGRELKPAHLMLAAFIGGFLAARKVTR